MGYMPSQVLYHLRSFAKFDLWLKRRKQRLWRVGEKNIDEFLNCLRIRHRAVRRGAPLALRLLLAFLRDIGVVSPKGEPIASTAAQRVANEYRVFLKEERGLARCTIADYSRHVDRFLAENFGIGQVNLRRLGGPEITTFVRCHASRHGRGLAAQMVTGLRSFFRFARCRGLIASDLTALVPPVANWTMSGLPKHLPIKPSGRCLVLVSDHR
jgi:hypothetical protein